MRRMGRLGLGLRRAIGFIRAVTNNRITAAGDNRITAAGDNRVSPT